jgi:hypothetical protein
MPDIEKVIKGLIACTSDNSQADDEWHDCENCPYAEDCATGNTGIGIPVMADAIVLLKEQDAKPPVHIHEEYPEHDWERKENGDIDDFAYDGDYHNGPMCKRCYYSFCIHCDPNGWNKKPCIIDEYNCPKCGRYISKGTKFCSDCGQAVKWNEAQCSGAILD